MLRDLARRPWLTTIALAILGGGLAALAHSRLAIWPAALLAPAVILPLGLGASRSRRLVAALLFGSVGSLGLVSLAWVPALAVALILAAVLETLVALTLLATLHRRLPPGVLTLVYPCVVVAAEFALAHSPVGTAFSDAYAFHAAPPLLQLAAITGFTGLSFLAAWIGSVLGLVLWAPRGRVWALPLALVVVALLGVLIGGTLALRRAPGETMMVAAIHAPAPPGKPEDLAQNRDRVAAYAPLAGEASARGARVVIWPEMILSVEASWEAALMDQLAAIARDTGTWQVVGVFHRDPPRNVAHVLDPRGRPSAAYQKAHPVTAMEASAPGAAPAPVVPTGHGRLGVLICNDDVFTDVSRQLARHGAQVVADPTWDWAAVAWRHAQITRVRAVETGVSYVRATRGGISQLIDPRGRVLAEHSVLADPHQVLVGAVPLGTGATPYARVGSLFPWLVVGLLIGLVIGTVRPRRPASPSA